MRISGILLPVLNFQTTNMLCRAFSNTISSLSTSIYQNKYTRLQACEVYCPDDKMLRGETLSEASSTIIYPPLIYHIRAERQWASLIDMIELEAGMPPSYVMELIRFGAIYFAADGDSSSKVKRITDTMVKVPILKGAYCRVHANPRRYPAAYFLKDWHQLIRFQNEQSNLIFVDKVAGLPVSATVDNLVENLQYQLTSHIFGQDPCSSSRPQQLYLSSRLDACTSGVLPFSKDAETSAKLNKVISGREISKIYRVLCRGPVAVGVLRHCFRRKSKRHDNAKPTLLREYDPRLVDPIPIDNHNQGGSNNEDTSSTATLQAKKKSTSTGTSSSSSNSRGGVQIGRVWQLAELVVLSCRKLAKHELSDTLLQQLGPALHYSEKNLDEVIASSVVDKPTISCSAGSNEAPVIVTKNSPAAGLTKATAFVANEKVRAASRLSLKSRLQRRRISQPERQQLQLLEHNNNNDKNTDEDSSEPEEEFYECEVELITGRTHQIRLQFAAIGCPIVGDSRYEPVSGLLDDTGDVDQELIEVFAAAEQERRRSINSKNSIPVSSSYNDSPPMINMPQGEIEKGRDSKDNKKAKMRTNEQSLTAALVLAVHDNDNNDDASDTSSRTYSSSNKEDEVATSQHDIQQLPVVVGDGAGLFGPEPKMIGLQCNRLLFPISVAKEFNITTTVPTDNIPSSTVPTYDVPTDNIPSSIAPTNDVPTKNIPSSTVPTNDVPTNNIPSITAPPPHSPANISLAPDARDGVRAVYNDNDDGSINAITISAGLPWWRK